MVGCGGIAGSWLTPLSKRKDIEVVSFIDLKEESAAKRAQEFGYKNAFITTSLEKALKERETDVVFCCTIPEAHYGVIMTALKHGCHVLTEKPLASSMNDARKIVQASAKAKKICAVIQNRRYQQNIQRLVRFIQSGKIGKVSAVYSDFAIGAHFGGFRDVMQNVLLLDMSIHTFDAARLISGGSPKSVVCHEWNPKGSWYKHGAAAIATFEMKDGSIYNYRGSWCYRGKNTTWEASWTIYGEKGAVTWDGAEGFDAEVVAKEDGFVHPTKKIEVPKLPKKLEYENHAGVIDEFIRSLKKGTQPQTAASDNIKSLAMVFGAIESAKAGKRVAIRD